MKKCAPCESEEVFEIVIIQKFLFFERISKMFYF